jgi:hypothetical protein
MEAGRDTQGANLEGKKENILESEEEKESRRKKGKEPRNLKNVFSCCCVYAYASFKHQIKRRVMNV